MSISVLMYALAALLCGALIAVFYDSSKRWLVCSRQRRQIGLDAASLHKALELSQRAQLQAQLEPEALLSTLGHIKSLYEADSAQAEKALDALVAQLQASSRGEAVSAS